LELTWTVKGNYSLSGSDRIEAQFTIEINDETRDVVSFDYKDMLGGAAIL